MNVPDHRWELAITCDLPGIAERDVPFEAT